MLSTSITTLAHIGVGGMGKARREGYVPVYILPLQRSQTQASFNDKSLYSINACLNKLRNKIVKTNLILLINIDLIVSSRNSKRYI